MYNGFIVRDNFKNSKIYDGNTLKFGITVDGEDFIVKSGKNSITSIYSEYVASRFIKELGIPVHDVWIGYYQNDLVVIIKDFTIKGYSRLQSFKDTRQSSEGTDLSSKTYTYTDVLRLIEKHTKMNDINKEKMKVRFWDMFICDAILGNRDRHHGNWGYLVTKQGHKPAPIYDNGGSLFPDVERVIDQYISNDKQFLMDRSERFPASLFRIDKGNGETRRTNYNEILSDLRVNKILAQEVKSLKEKIGYKGVKLKIYKIVSEVHNIIPEVYSMFYVDIICMRYLHLIERYSLEESYQILRGVKPYEKQKKR